MHTGTSTEAAASGRRSALMLTLRTVPVALGLAATAAVTCLASVEAGTLLWDWAGLALMFWVWLGSHYGWAWVGLVIGALAGMLVGAFRGRGLALGLFGGLLGAALCFSQDVLGYDPSPLEVAGAWAALAGVAGATAWAVAASRAKGQGEEGPSQPPTP